MTNSMILALSLTTALGCSKSEPRRADPVPVTPASATSIDDASGPADASMSKASATPSFTADFEAEEASLTLPEDVKWKGDTPATEGVGKGSLDLAVDAEGRVKGTGSGPFGDVILVGVSRDGVISGSILRKAADEAGFTGVFIAMESGGKWAGSLAVSRSNAGGLRRASFTLVKR